MDPAFKSFWLDTLEKRDYPRLSEDVTVDVAVLGGGIVGVTAALLLKRQGASVALLEARRIGSGVTGYTTAKLSSLHGLTYADLASSLGEEAARAYAEANEAGLQRIADWVEELKIDCDFRRKPNLTYAEDPGKRDQIEAEVEAARAAGLSASLVESVEELPYPVAAAVRVEDQAEFHPLRYLQALCAQIPGDGAEVYERSRVASVDQGSPCRVRSEDGAVVEAGQVIVATHQPILDRGLFFARVHPERSYVVLTRAKHPELSGMYLSAESPAHSLRSIPSSEGELLIVGGESHKTGHGEAAERYAALEGWAKDRFEVESVTHRWATQDNMPVDGMPFVGQLWPFSDRVRTATGLKKWGLAAGTAAAIMLADAISGRENPWAEQFDPMRLNPGASAKELLAENADAGWRFVSDRISKRASVDEIEPGEGKVVGAGIAQRAVHRDADGNLHSLSARCTHLGCIVNWNRAEETWDCPCHGSRFDSDGEVIEGPAVRPLRKHQLPVEPAR
jgi:glycine/D-amino acid oxidase-like deaminating enzyme/nitrite reductase/ring-hydroxylating ferredoxin subunit